MNFQIGGKRYEVAREDVFNATRNRTPMISDGRHKYFVRLHDRHYPIKQVIQLVTGLTPPEFTSQYAHGISHRAGFRHIGAFLARSGGRYC